jgi:uncharacterized protein (TIGR03437 family)
MRKMNFSSLLFLIVCMWLPGFQTLTWWKIPESCLAALLAPKRNIPSAMQVIAPAPFGKYIENINGVRFDLVRIPTGTFFMGNDRSPNPEEKPVHQVSIRSFYLGQYEITREQWNVVAETLPKVQLDLRKQFIGQILNQVLEPISPADAITWDEAAEFCERLTRFTGRLYRLPSEAEWEYACRAGTKTEYSFGDQFDRNLANLEFAADFMLPVGKLGYANAWGLFDMHGNVSEWVQDYEHPNYVGAPTDGSAWVQTGNSTGRILRGSRYRWRPETGRSSSRFFSSIYVRATGDGLRIVAEVPPSIGNGRVAAASAASYTNASLASESIAALFGANLSGNTLASSVLPLPTVLAGISVTLKDSRGHEHLAPLFFASPSQINFLLPAGLPPGPATVYAGNNGNIHSSGALEITNISPGLFAADASGRGWATAVALRVKADGTQVYEPVVRFDPAQNRLVAVPIEVSKPSEQVFLLLFGTGFRHRSSLANVNAHIGGIPAEVLFAGAQGELAGLDQANLRLPPTLAGRGEVEITLTADGRTSNAVSVQIK